RTRVGGVLQLPRIPPPGVRAPRPVRSGPLAFLPGEGRELHPLRHAPEPALPRVAGRLPVDAPAYATPRAALPLRDLGRPHPLAAEPRALPSGVAGGGGPLAGVRGAAPAGHEGTGPVGGRLPKPRPAGVRNGHDPRRPTAASV